MAKRSKVQKHLRLTQAKSSGQTELAATSRLSSLSQRADTTALLYNTLSRIAPEDDEGVKRAFVSIDPQGIEIDIPKSTDFEAAAALYGVEPVSVATLTAPFSMIPSREPMVAEARPTFDRSLLRQALRRLVDEV